MSRLINCLQKVTNKVEITDPKTGKPKKIDVFDHETKRGMISVAQRKLASGGMTIQEAEMETIRELRDKAAADIAKVEEALVAEAAPKVQAAAPRRPVDRDVKTAEAFASMHAHPEKALLLAQRIQKEYQRVRAQTMALVSALPAGTPKGEIKDLRKIRAFAELDALVSALPPEVSQSVGPAYTLAKLRATDASIGDYMVKRIEAIDRELERYFKKIYIERIESLLTSKKAKRQPSGVVKSTIGADAQDVIIRVTGLINLTGEEVAKKYQAIEAELLAGGLDPDEESAKLMDQHELSMFGAIKTMSAGQLEAAHADLANTVAQGKAAWGAKEEARLKDQKLKAVNLISVLPTATESGVRARNRADLTNWFKNYARNHTSFVQILERLFPGANFNKQWASAAVQADQTDQAYVRDVNTRFFNAIATAAGSRSQWKIGGILEDMRNKSTILVPDGGKATKNEAIHFLFMWAQPKIQETMKLSGWTDKHIQTLRDATADPVSQAIMTFMRNAYEEIYQKADPVYVSQYGMHLPRVEGQYAPVRRRVAGSINEMTPTGLGPSSGITPSSLKGRVDNTKGLLQVDAMDVFREHLMQMSHWIHFAPFIRETRGVLGNAKVKQALEMQIGREGVGDLQKQLDTITRNGVARSMEVSAVNKMVDYITRGFAVTVMGFNAATAVIQGDSMLRWLQAIPMQRWGPAFLGHNWLKNINKGWDADSVQNRVMGGMNPAMQAAMQSGRLTPGVLLRWVNNGFWHLRMTDGALTSLSSAIVYTDAINQGMTHEQAVQAMDEAVARFSQPTLSVAKSQGLLTGGAASRMLLMFMADPVLKTALVAEGFMNIGRGIARRDMALVELGLRRIVAVEIWSLFSQVLMCIWGSLFNGDDDEEIWDYRKFIRALAAAPVQGWFLAGNIGEGIIRTLAGEKLFPPSTPLGRIVQSAQRGLSNWDDLMLLDPTDPDFRKALEGLMDVVGGVAGPGAIVPAAVKETSKAVGAVENFREKRLE